MLFDEFFFLLLFLLLIDNFDVLLENLLSFEIFCFFFFNDVLLESVSLFLSFFLFVFMLNLLFENSFLNL